MTIRITHMLLPAAAVLGLAACDNEPEVADANLADINGTAAAGPSYAGTEASLDPNNLRTDVTLLLGSGTGTAGTGAAAGGAADGGQSADGNASAAGGSAAGAGDSNASGAAGGAGTGAGGMAAGDRDADGRLSPAEYAALTMPSVDPAQKAPGANDEMRPYVSDEALNEAIVSFRRLDTNGDFYLSADEYRAAS